MERLDYYELAPSGMNAYLSAYGHHISKNMYQWAVSMMKDRNGNRTQAMDKADVERVLASHGVNVLNNKGYDVPYVFMMAKMDYYGSSIQDEMHLARYVKDYLDDVDGSSTRAFDELYIKTVSLGIPIIWDDII